MRRLFCILVGFSLALFGALGTVFGIIGILDPVGSKMADDDDPFGPPPTTTESMLMLLAYLVLVIVGGWLSRRGGRRGASAGTINDVV